MSVLRDLIGRLRGDELRALRADVQHLAGLRADVQSIGTKLSTLNTEVTDLRAVVLQLNHIVEGLNHDVRSGSPESLPLFLGYAERFRTDADTVVGASVVIDRLLARIEDQVQRFAPATGSMGDD